MGRVGGQAQGAELTGPCLELSYALEEAGCVVWDGGKSGFRSVASCVLYHGGCTITIEIHTVPIFEFCLFYLLCHLLEDMGILSWN